ncbi:hypothetical protein V8G54_001960 [Vigna mungo]|uniref:Retrotransposon gag domain-containing protein n=1 Tax=Vigna mungo TaxID=3915 RepID=A0AAQ3SC04_VIGMU
MENRVGHVEEEVIRIKAIMEELRLQAFQNHSALEEMRQEAAENQTKMMELMTRSFEKRIHEEGECSVGNRKTEPKKNTKGGVSLTTLEGDALGEFRQSVKRIELPTFNGDDRRDGFRERRFTSRFRRPELLERYGGMGEGSVYDQLTALNQTGSMDEYIGRFECLIAQIPKLHDEQYFSYFTHGLREEVRAKVRSLHIANPLTRGRLMNVARAIDLEVSGRDRGWHRRNERHVVGGDNLGHKTGSNIMGRVGQKGYGANGWSNGSGPNWKGGINDRGARERGVRHLSYQDLVDRRKKGLCFKCGGPYGPNHQCPIKQLRAIVAENEIQVEFEDEEEIPKSDGEGETEEVDGVCTAISLFVLEKEIQDAPRTMKLKGMINGVPLLILIDSGASHNFVSRRLVKAMEWEWKNTRRMRILMGDGHQTETAGVCRELKIVLETGEFVVDAFLFELEDIDLILGMAWLESLGEMWVDWKKQIMKLNSAQGIKVLRGTEKSESLSSSLCKFEIEGETEKEEETSQTLLEKLKQTLGKSEECVGVVILFCYPINSGEYRLGLLRSVALGSSTGISQRGMLRPMFLNPNLAENSSFHTYALPCALDPVPAVYSSVDHHFYQFALSPHYPAHVPMLHWTPLLRIPLFWRSFRLRTPNFESPKPFVSAHCLLPAAAAVLEQRNGPAAGIDSTVAESSPTVIIKEKVEESFEPICLNIPHAQVEDEPSQRINPSLRLCGFHIRNEIETVPNVEHQFIPSYGGKSPVRHSYLKEDMELKGLAELRSGPGEENFVSLHLGEPEMKRRKHSDPSFCIKELKLCIISTPDGEVNGM